MISFSPTAWMAKNGVAANLLMLAFLIGGYFSLQGIKQEVFPAVNTNAINVSVGYPGSGPEEIEKGIVQSIESQIRGIDGVKRITSSSVEGLGTVTAELFAFSDQQKVLQDIKNQVDRITTFPADAERAQVNLVEGKSMAISLVLYADEPYATLEAYARKIKNDLITLDGITLVELNDPRPTEVSVEVSQARLRELNLTLPTIANQINQYARSVPSGSIDTAGGEVLIRTKERREAGSDFDSIPIVRGDSVAPILLGDIAEISDGHDSEGSSAAYYQGKSAILLNVYSVGGESPVAVADIAKAYVSENQLESGIGFDVFSSRSDIYKGRINLLIKNATLGLVLVLLILGIFLDARLAFWVMLGLPISMLGSFIFFQFSGSTLNMVSLFAFIITLGIVVDDAVIVGEAIYEERQKGRSFMDAAVFGAKEMLMPVTFAILTNMVAFMPLMFIPGPTGDIFRHIPAVIIAVLTVSLVESLFILPAHLSHTRKAKGIWVLLNIPQKIFSRWLEKFTHGAYLIFINIAIAYRYTVVALCIAMMLISAGFVGGGIINFTFLPRIDRDVVNASARLPFGAPSDQAQAVYQQLVDGVYKAAEKNGGEDIIKGVYGWIIDERVRVRVSLADAEKRDIGGIAFSQEWRKNTAKMTNVESISYRGRTGFSDGGNAIQIELTHPDGDIQQQAAVALAAELEKYTGVTDISDGLNLGKQELSLRLTPQAQALNISTQDIASQLRASFYGVSALRQQRGEVEMEVIVRLPETERQQFSTLENLSIQTSQGYIPLSYLASIEPARAFTEIKRTQGNRVIAVTADIDEKLANLNDVMLDLEEKLMPEFTANYPGLSYAFEGEDKTKQEVISFLKVAFFIALMAIYALLAIPFKSYSQPMAVMFSIPFGIIGAVLGHLILGYDVSIISLIGIIGLSGIVINDSMILIVTLNRYREEGFSAFDAAIKASTRRLRPILLTSVTTFFGLLPMLFETSVQAKFLIPMAISIGFGIMFATVIILVLVPSLYIIIEDVKSLYFKDGDKMLSSQDIKA